MRKDRAKTRGTERTRETKRETNLLQNAFLERHGKTRDNNNARSNIREYEKGKKSKSKTITVAAS